jgi:hypothetical protein
MYATFFFLACPVVEVGLLCFKGGIWNMKEFDTGFLGIFKVAGAYDRGTT